MRYFFTMALLFVFVAVSAQDKKTDTLDLDKYRFDPPKYIISPCYCPSDGTIKIKEYDKNNPYRYTEQKPIILKPSDSLLAHWAKLEKIFIESKKDTVPVL